MGGASRQPDPSLAERCLGLPRVRAPDHALACRRARGDSRAREDERAGRADLPQGARARAGLPRAAPGRGEERRRRSRRGEPRRAGRARRARRSRPASTSSTRACSSPTAGAGSPTSSCGSRTARYEALDTKLARHAKPAYILQLCFYSEQLARLQGREPEHIHVLLGNGELRVVPAARVRRLRAARPLAARAVRRRRRPPTEPYPSDHCGICEFKRDLRRVVGRGRPPLPRRRPLPQPDREARGRRDHDARRARARAERAAARPQRRDVREAPPAGRAPARPRARPASPSTSCSTRSRRAASRCCPTRRPGDLFFDFEGNPFWDEQGSARVPVGRARHGRRLHAALGRRPRDRAARVRGSSSTSSTSGSRADPTMHVYHYAAYEITALRRLMGRYGTREAEVDDLLRRGVFVDLYKVVKGGLRRVGPRLRAQGDGGVPRLRARTRRSRTAAPRSSSTSATSRRATARSSTRSPPTTRRTASRRCALRDWLLERRGEALAQFGPFPLPEPEEPKPTPPGEARARRAAGGAARGGRGARRAAPRLPRPRAQAGLVGVLRPDRADARGAGRGRRLDRPARAGRRAGAGRALARPPLHVPAAGAQAAVGRAAVRPSDGPRRGRRSSSSTARRGRSRSSAARRSPSSAAARRR